MILPRQNERNINEDISEDLRRDLTVHYVTTVDEALAIALTPPARGRKAKPAAKKTAAAAASAAKKRTGRMRRR